jgi:hypothetical protein
MVIPIDRFQQNKRIEPQPISPEPSKRQPDDDPPPPARALAA